MTDLTLRVYNVLFGDALFLRVPDRDEAGHSLTRSILIDCGNALAGAHGDDDTLRRVMRGIYGELGGAPLDLYIMTHEHMDHIQGPLMASRKDGINLKARHVWMTASSAPGYYEAFPDAKKKRRLAMDALEDIHEAAENVSGALPLGLDILLEINNPRASADCVDHIRKMAVSDAPQYIARDAPPGPFDPFREAAFRILAPEQNSAVYYGRLRPRSVGLHLAAEGEGDPGQPGTLNAPEGVSARDFADLLRFRAEASFDNMLHIDKAANNSSIVFELTWQGWRLLFPGDAEEKSWALMDHRDALQPVHFLKVSHHGSANGTPPEVFDSVLPSAPADERDRLVVVSTTNGAYSGVPSDKTLVALSERARLLDTRTLPAGGWFDISFPASGNAITVTEGPVSV